MGAAVAETVLDLGGEVVVMDKFKIALGKVTAISIDLAEKASIDGAIAKCGGRVDALFSCAGVADGTPGIERINFIGHRYMIDRLFEAGMFSKGAAIGFISSAAGMGWEPNLPLLQEFLKIEDFDAATAWVHEHGKADYMWSKQAICAYVAQQALPFLKRQVRINAILPGPTDTPLARENADRWLRFGADYRQEANVEVSTPIEQARPLVFLCSDAASVITGITLITDAGLTSSAISESFPAAKMIINFLRGVGGAVGGAKTANAPIGSRQGTANVARGRTSSVMRPVPHTRCRSAADACRNPNATSATAPRSSVPLSRMPRSQSEVAVISPPLPPGGSRVRVGGSDRVRDRGPSG